MIETIMKSGLIIRLNPHLLMSRCKFLITLNMATVGTVLL